MNKLKRKKWKMNPILKKELMVGSRSIKMSMLLMGLNLFLTVIVLFVMVIAENVSSSYDYKNLVSLFPVLAIVECSVFSLIIPVITSNSISGERERQTLDIMLTTPMKPMGIIVGKLQSAIAVTMMYMISTIPLLSIAFILGGMNWVALFGLIVMMLYLGIYIGSVGIFCSSVVKKSVAATILTIVIGVSIIMITFIIFGVWNGLAEYISYVRFGNNYNYQIGFSLSVLLFNPYSSLFDFVLRSVSSESIYSLWAADGSSNLFLVAIYKAWIPISMILNLLISYGFLWLASKKLVVKKVKRGKK